MATATADISGHRKPWYQHLYAQVLIAIVLGVLLGHFWPDVGASMKPLGDTFIKLIKMLIAPIIFCTVVHGIASMEDMKKVGRVGIKALIYFEGVTTLALIIGLLVVNVWQPGVGMNVNPSELDTKGIETYTAKAGEQSTVEFLTHNHPGDRRRRLCRGRDPAGSVLRRAVCLRSPISARLRQTTPAGHRPDRARVLPYRRHHHEDCADRRLRRHGVHDRQIWHRHARLARRLDGRLLQPA
jgi:hypothetical protein